MLRNKGENIFDASETYWDGFYSSFTLQEPSTFAIFLSSQLSGINYVVDMGCGNGRDTIYLSKILNCPAIGLDASTSAINQLTKYVNKSNLPNEIKARTFALGADEQPNEIETKLLLPHGGAILVYLRFVLHAINETAESHLWKILEQLIGGSARVVVAFEFRTIEDKSLPKETPQHYRRFIEPSAVAEELTKLGLFLNYEVQGRGFSPYGLDDPFLCRQIYMTAESVGKQ